jgi:hypothetical protein
LLTKENKLPFSVPVCRKQVEVAVSISSISRILEHGDIEDMEIET